MPRQGSTSARGYGWLHQRIRELLLPEAIGTPCWRCGVIMLETDDLDLGHDDEDRTKYRGIEHASCNRRAGAIKSNRNRVGFKKRSSIHVKVDEL